MSARSYADPICGRFGDGVGALSYVGPCDADVARDNSVTLELLDLMRGATPAPINDDTYQNPCGEIADWGVDRSVLADGEDDFGPSPSTASVSTTLTCGSTSPGQHGSITPGI